ncbi:NAD(P)H-dependent oxidoreductase [Bacillaceae bacterium Marseille-Q3522]|nr:NAD(P)H-dependent oxidoreductase [Bacillaceae bacterium Marseille-Q3522]
MENVLIINGHETYPSSQGKLNETVFSSLVEKLSPHYKVKTTVIADGYQVEEEGEKFNWADIIIFQTPVFWFSIPGTFKTYIDKVYQYGLFFSGSETYGRGGLFTDKKYMLSTTWNAPADVFSNPEQFFNGKTVDDIFLPFHKTQEFCGLKQLKSFSLHDVIKNPDIEQDLKALDKHLKEVFSI